MGLLDGIERLINEHGSAAILRERIALANDKYSALESENSIIKSQNEALKLDNKKLKEQVRHYEKQLKELESPRHGNRVPKAEEEILLLLLQGPMEERDVIQAIGKGAEPTRFNLVELANAGLIEHKSEFQLPTLCGLTQDGRRYLKEKAKRLEFAGDNSSEYAEAGGALFKRIPSGGYSVIPYCPKCHSAMSYFAGPFPFTCGNQACKQEAGFSKRDLEKVMSNLPL
jgi:hypothetical protein